jgi:hypothetical protein
VGSRARLQDEDQDDAAYGVYLPADDGTGGAGARLLAEDRAASQQAPPDRSLGIAPAHAVPAPRSHGSLDAPTAPRSVSPVPMLVVGQAHDDAEEAAMQEAGISSARPGPPPFVLRPAAVSAFSAAPAAAAAAAAAASQSRPAPVRPSSAGVPNSQEGGGAGRSSRRVTIQAQPVSAVAVQAPVPRRRSVPRAAVPAAAVGVRPMVLGRSSDSGGGGIERPAPPRIGIRAGDR